MYKHFSETFPFGWNKIKCVCPCRKCFLSEHMCVPHLRVFTSIRMCVWDVCVWGCVCIAAVVPSYTMSLKKVGGKNERCKPKCCGGVQVFFMTYVVFIVGVCNDQVEQ